MDTNYRAGNFHSKGFQKLTTDNDNKKRPAEAGLLCPLYTLDIVFQTPKTTPKI
jgi:hypothetical protein